MRRARKRFLTAAGVVAAAATLLLGEAVVKPDKAVYADSWQFYASPVQEYCEGCCGGGNLLCCSSAQRCRIYPT